MSENVVKVEKPMVQLTGQDGNAFAIIGNCKRAWSKAGKDRAEFEPIMKDMMSGDYDHLLQVALKHFDVR